MRRLSVVLLIACLLVSALSGCSLFKPKTPTTPDTETPTVAKPRGTPDQYGGTLIAAINGDPVTLDPAKAVTSLDCRLMALIYNGLVRLDDTGKVVPDLAKSWTVSGNGLSYTFTLSRGARFHNGKELTSADVVYSLERLRDANVASPRSWLLRQVGTIVADGKYGVRINLKQAFAPLLSLLAMPAAYIVDQNEVARYGDATTYGLNPVGTGPFRLVSMVPGDQVSFEAFADYFAARPLLDGVTFHVMRDGEMALSAYQTGNLDLVDVPSASVQRIMSSGSLSALASSRPDLSVYYVAINCERPVISDVRVRQAMNYAVDRAAIVKACLPGQAEPATGPIPPGVTGRTESANPFAFSVTRAKALLTEAGYKGEQLQLIFRGTRSTVVDNIVAALGKAGIKVKAQGLDREGFFRTVGAGDFDLAYISWTADYPEASNFLWPTFHSANKGDGGNRARFADAQIDALIDQAMATTDATTRAAMYREIEVRVMNEAPWIPLYYPTLVTLRQANVEGWKPYLIPMADKPADVWLRK